jgi:hypothetical protein
MMDGLTLDQKQLDDEMMRDLALGRDLWRTSAPTGNGLGTYRWMELGGYAFRAVSTRKGTSPGGGDDIWGFGNSPYKDDGCLPTN